MARYKTKRKISWKQIVSGILVVGLLLGAVGLGISIFGNQRKDISNFEFEIGRLTTTGKYEESEQHIYTKEMFSCKGLKVEPDFSTQSTYQIFYYDYHGEFLMATEDGLSTTRSDVPLGAYYCRIVITPHVSEGEDRDEFKINWWQVHGYADDFKISVTKDQTPVNYFEKDEKDLIAMVQDNKCVYVEKDGVGYTKVIDCTEIDEFLLIFKGDAYATSCVFIKADGTAQSFAISAGDSEVHVNPGADVVGVVFNYDVGEEYSVIAYKPVIAN